MKNLNFDGALAFIWNAMKIPRIILELSTRMQVLNPKF